MILHGQLAESAPRTEVDRYSVPVYSSAVTTCSVLLYQLHVYNGLYMVTFFLSKSFMHV